MTAPAQTLARPQAAGWLLSFDFDGTLHHPGDEPPVCGELFAWLARLRREHAAVWVVNTGRSLGHFLEGMAAAAFPFLPDYVVARESEIYQPDRAGQWAGVEPWNRDCERRQRRLLRRARPLLRRFGERIGRETGAEWVRQDGEPAALIARSEEGMDWICTQLEGLRAQLPDLGWQRNSIYLRFGDRRYHKGSALAALAARLDVPTARTFAIGDGHNDLGMLDPQVAGWIACPANAVPEVKDHVARHHGLLATRPHSAGVVETLERVFATTQAA